MAKILVADDEQLIRKLINDCLSKSGHEILEAADGLEAINIFKKNKDIDMALLDIMMPEIDGWEVCRKIRETSGIPIVLVSARSQDFDQIMGFESGADDYVTKPFSLTVLTKRVDALLKRGAAPKEKKTEKAKATIYLRLLDSGKYLPLLCVVDSDNNEILSEDLPETIDLNSLGEIQLSGKKVTVKPRKNALASALKPISFEL